MTKIWKLIQSFETSYLSKVHELTLQDAYVCDSVLLCNSVQHRKHPPLQVSKFLNTAVNFVLDMLLP